MEQSVKNSVYTLMIILFTFTMGCKAQANFDENIEFSHTRGTRQIKLLQFLGLNYDPEWVGDKCYQGLEKFNFSVNSSAKVINITHEGNLPNYMVEPMLKAIEGLDDKWIIHKGSDRTLYNFKLSLVVMIHREDDCDLSKYSALLEKDFGINEYIKLSENSYELKPFYWGIVR